MLIVLGFCAAVLVGVGVALVIASRGQPREDAMSWNIVDIGRMQVSLMGTLGSVSITGIVLIISLLTNRFTDPGSTQLNTVATMFGITFGYFLQSFYTLSYLPDRTVVSERLFRFYFGLGTTLQWRTVVLLVMALVTFVEFYGLSETILAMYYFIPLSIVSVFLVVAVVEDSLGLLGFGECYLLGFAGLALSGLFCAAMFWRGGVIEQAPMTMAIIFAAVNGLSYAAVGLVPLSPRRPRLRAFLIRHARLIMAIDMEITVISMLFLWMSVTRLV